jgi:hypothetical protein
MPLGQIASQKSVLGYIMGIRDFARLLANRGKRSLSRLTARCLVARQR